MKMMLPCLAALSLLISLSAQPTHTLVITAEQLEAENRAALNKLPSFDRHRLGRLVTALEKTKFPIEFKELQERLGGKSTMVWIAGVSVGEHRKYRSTDTYALSKPSLEYGTYVLVVDYAKTDNARADSSPVVRARIAFESPFEWRFYAESTKQQLEVGKQNDGR